MLGAADPGPEAGQAAAKVWGGVNGQGIKRKCGMVESIYDLLALQTQVLRLGKPPRRCGEM